MSTLMKASNQWMTRPADQRFASLAQLDAAVRGYREISAEATVDLRTCRVAVGASIDGHGAKILQPGDVLAEGTAEPVLIGQNGTPAQFTHYSFGQFARHVGAPSDYMRSLTPALAVANLNHGIRQRTTGEDFKLLFAQNGGLRLRCAVSPKYTRIWNSDITSRLIQLTQQSPEWQPAPEAFDGSRGLYASDSDMFAFLVDNDRRIFEKGPAGGLGRGFFVWNSEVGASSFGVMTFMYEYVCGNHRVWGAKGIAELRIPHIGDADEKAFAKLNVELKKYADSSSADDELKVAQMHRVTLGAKKEEVLDRVFGLNTGLTKRVIERAYDVAEAEVDKYGAPNTVWGYTGGLTQIARDMPNTADRVKTEKSAAKVMQIAF